MPGVAVVTDSTSSSTPDQAAHAHVRVIALQVVLDGESRSEDEVDPAEVAAALRAGRPVRTSRPARRRSAGPARSWRTPAPRPSSRRTSAALAGVAVARAPSVDGPVDLAVHLLDDPAGAAQVVAGLAALVPGRREVLVAEGEPSWPATAARARGVAVPPAG